MRTSSRFRCSFSAGLVAVAAFSGCATDGRAPRVVFPHATINGQPVRLAMDSGAGTNWIYQAEAGQLGMAFTLSEEKTPSRTRSGWSEPVQTTAGNNLCVAPYATVGMLGPQRFLLWITGQKEMRGAFGWPALRDNILVFDAAQKTVRRVDLLPPETADWTKIRLRSSRDSHLVLLIPFAEGKTRPFLVDTGDPGGVTLSDELWANWRGDHPQARMTRTYAWFLGRSRPERRESVQADTLALGPLQFTNLPVFRQSAYEKEMKFHEGTLGFQALERMALVVDGKNGFAYAKTLPPAAQSPSDANRTWSVAGDVKLDVVPQRVLAARSKGSSLERAGDHEGAVASFNRAVDLDPTDSTLFLERAAARDNKGDHDGAIADVDRALALQPADGGSYWLRGAAYANKGDFARSLADFNRAVELTPKNTGAWVFRGMVKLNQGDLSGAIADADRALELDPVQGGAFSVRGLAKFLQQNFREGVMDLDRALKLEPKNAALYASRALAKSELGDDAGAKADFRRAITLDPKIAQGGFSAGVALEAGGNFAGALLRYDQAIALKGDDAIDAALQRHLLLRRLGRPTGDFLPARASWSDPWKKTLAEFLTGTVTESALLAEVSQGKDADGSARECEAFYCLGMMRFVRGDQAGAREFWEKCRGPKYENVPAYQLVLGELRRLDQPQRVL